MKRKVLLLFLAAAGAPAFGADLLQVYRDALGYDAQYASARASLEAGQEKLPQGRAGLLPTLGLTANTVWNDVNSTRKSEPPTTTVSQFNTNAYALTLTQPLFRWQNIVQYGQSKLQVAQAEALFAQAKQDLALRATQAYFDVLLAEYALELAQAQKKSISEQLEQAKRNFEVGTATIVDTHEAQARFDLTTAQELAASSDLEVKRHALRQIIGKDAGTLSRLRQNVQINRPQPDDMNKWVEAAEQNSPLVAVQQAALEIAAKEVEKQRAGHYPNVDVVATRSRNASSGSVFSGISFGGSVTETNTIGLQLSLPLFAGGATVSRTDEAAALREKARADLENTRRSAALNARQSYLGVTSGMAQVKAYEQALVSSQSALDSNKLGYEVGVRINIDVLNAQQQLYSTRRDLAKARYDTLLAQLKLKAAAGGLGEDDVQAINALLEK
jgi:outer membrane protein